MSCMLSHSPHTSGSPLLLCHCINTHGTIYNWLTIYIQSRTHIWENVWDLSSWVEFILLNIMIPSSISLKMASFHSSLWKNKNPICIYTTFLYPAMCGWTPGLAPWHCSYDSSSRIILNVWRTQKSKYQEKQRSSNLINKLTNKIDKQVLKDKDNWPTNIWKNLQHPSPSEKPD